MVSHVDQQYHLLGMCRQHLLSQIFGKHFLWAHRLVCLFVSSRSVMETTVSKLCQIHLIVPLKSETQGTLTNSLSFEASSRQCFHVYEFSGLDSRVSSLFSGVEESEIMEKKEFLSTLKCLKLLSFGKKQIKVNFRH